MLPPDSARRSAWLNDTQRLAVRQWSQSWLWRSELPTWLLMVTIYSGWFATLAFHKTLGLFTATALLILFTTWYLSLQHELIHGHPTRWPRLNQLFGLLPLAVWYPYGLYRDSHLAHHRNQLLTVPGEDPETYYFSAERWQRFSEWQQRVIHWRNTFVGRLLLAPLLDIFGVFAGMVASFRRLERPAIAMWLVHFTLLALVFYWLEHNDFPILWYLAAVSYPALAVTKVRSFLEHRAADDPLARSAITETSLPWRLLFLNLNYHSVHHDLPGVPWYGLRKVWLRDKERYQQRNQGFLVKGYREWWRNYRFRPVDVTVHPGKHEGETHGG
ncbi:MULTISPECIES: fatty acid desaturase [Enterobacterales]|uniref:fatty acid desaturase n=1 Tax=Enterobacterales TaxID=91347 RepID=UPI002ED8D6F2